MSRESGRRRVHRRDVVRVEQRDHLVPERARLARAALVGGRLAHERQPAASRACRRCRRGSGRARPGRGARAGRRRTGRARRARRRRGTARPGRGAAASLLEAEQEHGLEAARPRAREVEHRDRPRSRAPPRRTSPRSSAATTSSGDELAAEALPAVELVEQLARSRRGRAGRRARPRRPAAPRDRARFAASRPPATRTASTGPAAERRSSSGGSGCPSRRRIVSSSTTSPGGDRASAQPPFEEVDVRAREAGEGRAEERVEVAAAALLPGEAEQREQRLPERRLAEPERGPRPRTGCRACRARSRPARASARRTGRRARSPPAGCPRRRARGPPPRRARACRARRPPRGSGSRRRARRIGRRLVLEEVPLEVRERRRGRTPAARGGSSSIAPAGERGEVLLRSPQRREGGTAGLVGQRDRDLRPRGERLEQRPTRRRSGPRSRRRRPGGRPRRRAPSASRSTARRRSRSRSQRPTASSSSR